MSTDFEPILSQIINQNYSIVDIAEVDVIKVLIALDNAYFNADNDITEPLVTDSIYDNIRRQAQLLYPLNEYFIGVGSSIREADAVKLPYLMGSLTQLHDNEVIAWLSKYNVDLDSLDGAVITDKEDGNSALLIYNDKGEFVKAYSRGDGIEGRDITRHFVKMSTVPKQLPSVS